MICKIKGKGISSAGDPKIPSESITHNQCPKKGKKCITVSQSKLPSGPNPFFPSGEARTDGGRCFSPEEAADSSVSVRPLFHCSSVRTPRVECYLSSACERGKALTWPFNSFGHCSLFSSP